MSTSKSNYSRHFSESLRREIVKNIDEKKLSVKEACLLYDVSRSSIFNWLSKYSLHYKRQTRMVMEKKSQASQVKKLQTRIKELEATLGRKQMELDYKNKLIEISEEMFGIEIEKKGVPPHSNGSGPTKNSTGGK